MDLGLTIQEVAEATQLSAHTLRYYEREGLLAPVPRSIGGQRRYSTRDVDTLLFLTRLRMTGMPIHMVRVYAELTRQGPSTIEQRKKLLEDHRENMLNQRAELDRNLAVLEYKIGLYAEGWVPSGSADPCLIHLRSLCNPKETK